MNLPVNGKESVSPGIPDHSAAPQTEETPDKANEEPKQGAGHQPWLGQQGLALPQAFRDSGQLLPELFDDEQQILTNWPILNKICLSRYKLNSICFDKKNHAQIKQLI